ncbi:MAG: ABC transporter permease subunit [Pseudomonadota bacterium]
MAETAPPPKPLRLGPLVLQGLIAAGLLLLIWGAFSNARTNLEALGLTAGFAFLDRTVGWGYSFSLVERSIDDTYARTLLIGVMNTVFVGLITIVTATILGFVIGTLRDVKNLALRSIADAFVHIFRNIPLILQLVFTYSVLIHMPGPRQALSLGDVAFLSNRGLKLPALNVSPGMALAMVLLSVAVAIAILFYSKAPAVRRGLYATSAALAVLMMFGFLGHPAGESWLSAPELQGLRFRGGITVSVELVAMIIAITLYGSAYVAEVVRGGLREVPKGIVEAGRSLGLSEFAIWLTIKVPLALRTILPPLGNQWIFIMKATTLGVAIGFSDLFYLVSTSITQSGQTLELIFLLMLAFLAINYSLALLVNVMNARLALRER